MISSTSTSHPAGSPKHLLALDGWRGMACIMVLYHHTGFWLHVGPLTVWGFTGVHLFFVLSGYLIYRPLCKAMQAGTPFGFNNFFIRRALRIYPPYLLAVLVFSAVRYVSRMHPPSRHNIVTHLLFVFNSSDPHEFFGINVALWTLAIEAQFYVVLPLISWVIYRMFSRQPNSAIFGVAILFLCIGSGSRGLELIHTTRAAMADEQTLRFHWVFSFLDCFGSGMFIAALMVAKGPFCTKLTTRVRGMIGVSGLVLFLAANAWCTHTGSRDWLLASGFWYPWGFPTLLCAGLAMILFVVVCSNNLLSKLLATRPMVYVGKVSYSIYLFHILVQLLMFRFLSLESITSYPLRTFCYGLVSLPPTLLVATLIYYLVEAPSLRLAERFKGLRTVGVSLSSSPVPVDSSNERTG